MAVRVTLGLPKNTLHREINYDASLLNYLNTESNNFHLREQRVYNLFRDLRKVHLSGL